MLGCPPSSPEKWGVVLVGILQTNWWGAVLVGSSYLAGELVLREPESPFPCGLRVGLPAVAGVVGSGDSSWWGVVLAPGAVLRFGLARSCTNW